MLQGGGPVVDCRIDLDRAKAMARSSFILSTKVATQKAHDLIDQAELCSKTNHPEIAEVLLRGAASLGKISLDLHSPVAASASQNLATLLYERGAYAEAEQLCRRALKVREEFLGPESPDTLLSLSVLALVLTHKENYIEAEQLARRFLSVCSKIFGKGTPATLSAEKALALVLRHKGDYVAAESLLRRILDEESIRLGTTHPDVIESTVELASLLVEAGKLAAAEQLLFRVVSIPEPDSRSIAAALFELGVLSLRRHHIESAESLFRRALSIQEHVVGPGSPSLVGPLTFLAAVIRNNGEYAEAESILRRALEIEESAFGNTSPRINVSLQNLASLLQDKGDFANAEAMYRRALRLVEERFGPDHPRTASVLFSLAFTLRKRLDFMKADELAVRAIEIQDKALGPEHPETIESRTLLAADLLGRGLAIPAEEIFRVSLSAQEQIFGVEHPILSFYLNVLAHILQKKEHYAEAEKLLQRAVIIQERYSSPTLHPLTSLQALTSLYVQKHDYATADVFLMRALRLSEHSAVDKPDGIAILERLALAAWAIGRRDEATRLLAKINRAQATQFSKWTAPLETEAQASWLKMLSPADIMISFNREEPADNEVAKEALWALLQRKGRFLELRAAEQRLANAKPDLFRRWRLAKQLSDLCTRNSFSNSLRYETGTLPQCLGTPEDRHRAVDQAGRDLLHAAPKMKVDFGTIEFSDLQGGMKNADSILIEIAQYRLVRPDRGLEDPGAESCYATYVLFPDGRVAFRDLGSSRRVDDALDKLRKLASDESSNLSAVREASKRLYAITLGQLEDLLEGHRKIYIGSDGDLGLLDFSLLVDNQGRWLIENKLIVNLTSGRDLARLGAGMHTRQRIGPDYLVTNPSFLFKRRPYREDKAVETGASALGKTIPCRFAFDNTAKWSRIGLSPRRVEGFNSALPGLIVLDRDQATESSVKQIRSPRTLWFITHGFFCEDSTTKSEGAGDQRQNWEDPMLRGALVLAGAQVGGAGDGEDGLLQSSEIIERNWAGTELVVLGACETALGVPHVGDGVYGMRRALTLAGVRSQVMTLWQVGQAPTFEVLQRFADLLHTGKDKAEALREAQVQMLRKKEHPYYWAGFYFIGDPSPLSTAMSASPNRN